MHPTGKNHAKEAIVGTQIRQICDARVVSKTHLLDKGFYKVGVIKILDAKRQQYVMPTRWSKKVDDIVAAYGAKEGMGMLPYEIRGGSGESVMTTRVIVKRKGVGKKIPPCEKNIRYL